MRTRLSVGFSHFFVSRDSQDQISIGAPSFPFSVHAFVVNVFLEKTFDAQLIVLRRNLEQSVWIDCFRFGCRCRCQ